MNKLNFTFSDTLAGYVQKYDKPADIITLKTPDGRDTRSSSNPIRMAGSPIIWKNHSVWTRQ